MSKGSKKINSTSGSMIRVSTGYDRLDKALQGGFLAGSAVVLTAPASDDIPAVLGNFLRVDLEIGGRGLLVCRKLSTVHAVAPIETENLTFLVCSETVPGSKNVIPGKSIDNLTELNLRIAEALRACQPSRVALDIVSDVVLRHKVLQARKWLADLIDRWRTQGITTLAVINPYMHSREEVEGIVDLFDGCLEIFETNFEGELQRNLRVRWMHGVEVSIKELPLLEQIPPGSAPSVQPTTARSVPFKEPRWLTPLVDREEESSKLKNAFQDSLLGKSSLIALEGEAGVGKTRLARELATYVQSAGSVVLTGRATEEKLPYGPWVEIARQYVGELHGELLRKMLGPHLSEFGRLVPDVAAKLGSIPSSKRLEDQQDRIRLYEAITQFLIAISRQSPLLLLLEDIHWADEASLNLLEHFVRSASDCPALTICCYRSEDAGPTSPLYKTILRLNRERLVETIPVRNLSIEETRDMIKQVFGEQNVSTELTGLIYQRTGGNPFFVEEVLRSLVEDGTIYRTEKGWDRKPIQEIVVPESVKATLRSRLNKLDSGLLGVLAWAAVVGPDFEFQLLREVIQLEEDKLLQSLEEALASGLLQEIPGRKDVFRFTDNRIRELLLSDLSQSRRARYHVKTAEAMEKIHSKNVDRHLESVADHYFEGGDTERGIKYSIMAGDKNRAIHAYEQAIKHYTRALDFIELEGRTDAEEAAVVEKLAESYSVAGRVESSSNCYERALAIFEKLHDFKGCGRSCLGLGDNIFRGKGFAGVREAIPVMKRGLDYLKAEADSFEAASIYAGLAKFLGIVDEWDEANAWAEKALQVGEKTRNFSAVAAALTTKGSFLTDTGKLDEGLPVWEKALEVSLQNEQHIEAIRSLHNLSVYTHSRDLAKAREMELRCLGMCERANDLIYECHTRCWIAWLDWLRGEWKAAIEWLRKPFEIQERLGIRLFFPPETLRAFFFISMGEYERAEEDLQTALRREDTKISVIVATNLALGILRREQGRVEEARVHFETCVNAFKNMEFTTWPIIHVETLLHLTSIYTNHGELEKAGNTAQWARRLAQQLRSEAGLAMASQAEAKLRRSLGEEKAALDAYLTCLDLWRKAGWPYYLARALVEYAEATAETSPDESRRRLEQAAEIFSKLGAKPSLEKVRAKLSSF